MADPTKRVWRPDEIEMVMSALDGVTPTPSGWYRVPCPFCSEGSNKKKMSVSADNGWFGCWRAECGAWGFLQLSEKHLAKVVKKKAPSTGIVALPAEFISIAPSQGTEGQFENSISLAPYFRYLKRERGLSDAIIEEAGLGICFGGRYATKVVIPIISGGNVVGFTSRGIAAKVYMNPPGFAREKYMLNEDALFEETTEPIIIVEGPFDCLVHWPMCVACCGKPSAYHIEKIKKARRPVIICLDADAQFEGWGLALRLELLGMDVKYMHLAPGYDPGKTPHEDFLRRALASRKASRINPDTYRGE